MGGWVTLKAVQFSVSGTCASYILIIKDQVHLLIQQIVSEKYYEDHWFVDSRILTIYITVIAIFPICMKRDLDFLKYPSYLVIFGIFFVVFDVFIRLAKPPLLTFSLKQGSAEKHAEGLLNVTFPCHANSGPFSRNFTHFLGQSKRNFFVWH